MTLIETHPGETESEFRTAIDWLLQVIAPDRPNWWHPYELRGTYDYREIHFRHLFCIAGSVEGWLWVTLSRCEGRRVILLTDESATVFGPITMYGRGGKIVVNPAEILPKKLQTDPLPN